MIKNINIHDIIAIAKEAVNIVSTQVIIKALKKYNVQSMSEEGKKMLYLERTDGECFGCIYPIDGTIRRNWDTVAADTIVSGSGKTTVQFENKKPMIYNKENLLNPWFVVQ